MLKSLNPETVRVLSQAFPSRCTVQIDGGTITAAGLAAWVLAQIQRGDTRAAVAQLPALGLVYSGGTSGDLDADLPTILRNVTKPADYRKLADVLRELVLDGYDCASGPMALLGPRTAAER